MLEKLQEFVMAEEGIVSEVERLIKDRAVQWRGFEHKNDLVRFVFLKTSLGKYLQRVGLRRVGAKTTFKKGTFQ